MLGYRAEELLANFVWDISDMTRSGPQLPVLHKTERPYAPWKSMSAQFGARTGPPSPVLVGRPDRERSKWGRPLHSDVFQDITERKQAEEKNPPAQPELGRSRASSRHLEPAQLAGGQQGTGGLLLFGVARLARPAFARWTDSRRRCWRITGRTLPEEGRRYLETIRGGAQKMVEVELIMIC